MTPKEKAIELVDKYRIVLIQSDTDASEEILCTIIAKQCALIAVGELLILAGFYDKKVWDYLEEVKQEIEKL